MQFNVEWLKHWVAIDLAPAELAQRLTAAGLEVDAVRPAVTAIAVRSSSVTPASD